MKIGEQQAINTFNQVRHITKRPSLRPIAINSQRIATKCLSHEVLQDPAIVESHPFAVGIENANDMGVQPVITVISHDDRFGKTLGLVITSAEANRIDVAPIFLLL